MSEATPPPGDNPPIPPTGGGTPPPPPPTVSGGTPPPPPPAYGQAPVPGMAPNGRTYADWVQRLVPFLIDYVPVIALGIIGSFFLLVTRTTAPVISRGEVNGSLYTYTTVEPVPSIFGLFMVSLCSLLGFCYFLWNKGYKEGTTGKSIGKSKYGTSTTVREETGEPLGAGRGIGRAFLLWIEIGLIGFCFIGLVCLLWPLWDAKRQTLLSDKLTGAVVYND